LNATQLQDYSIFITVSTKGNYSYECFQHYSITRTRLAREI